METLIDYKLEIYVNDWIKPERCSWGLRGNGFYICNEGATVYATVSSARRAARRAAHKLGITIISEEVF